MKPEIDVPLKWLGDYEHGKLKLSATKYSYNNNGRLKLT